MNGTCAYGEFLLHIYHNVVNRRVVQAYRGSTIHIHSLSDNHANPHLVELKLDHHFHRIRLQSKPVRATVASVASDVEFMSPTRMAGHTICDLIQIAH